MKPEEVRNKIRESGIIAAIRVDSRDDAQFAAEALHNGGIAVVEIALTVPGATDVISHLVKRYPDLIVGAGGILNAEAARNCLDAGARFLTSDGLRQAMIEIAARNQIVVFPGALTPTEVITAWDSGCDFVKVVPCAQIGGESYIRSLHRMFPHIPLIAAGGVNQQTASKYIFAGAIALGIGGELLPPGAIQRRQMTRIAELTRRFAGFVRSAREGKLPEQEGTLVRPPH